MRTLTETETRALCILLEFTPDQLVDRVSALVGEHNVIRELLHELAQVTAGSPPPECFTPQPVSVIGAAIDRLRSLT